MDVNQVLRFLDEEDSASVRSYSSECLDLVDTKKGSNEEVSDEEVPPKSKGDLREAQYRKDVKRKNW